MSTLLIMSRTLKLTNGLLVEVLTFNFLHTLLDMMFLSGCYFNNLMIVNNCLCSFHPMLGNNFLKHMRTSNLRLGILLDMLIYKNELSLT